MTHLKIKKGLNIPIQGEPVGEIRTLPAFPTLFFDFHPFYGIQPHVLVTSNDQVKLGQPLVEDKKCPGRVWISPATGVVREVLRGEKRRLLGISIEVRGEEEFEHAPLPANASKDEIVQFLARTGLLSLIFMRPFHLPAHPHLLPRSIFVKALESAPFTPSSEMQIHGQEENFQAGLDLLSQIAKTYLIYRTAFQNVQKVEHHTAEGPHPISHLSVHIQALDPIRKPTDVVWTIDAWGVVAIGKRLRENQTHCSRVVSFAGEGFLPEQRGYFSTRIGIPLSQVKGARILSGDPLMGEEVSFLGLFHSVCTALPILEERKFFHFFRFGTRSFTATRAYTHPKNPAFTTQLHGEVRPFIDPNVYDAVMPLRIPTVPLIKAILAQDFDRAISLGLLEVAPEDFSLPTFVCPSKIEMVEIVENGLHLCACDMLSL